VLAIFAGEDREAACRAALAAASRLRKEAAKLTRTRSEAGLPTTQVYLALHIGDVFYGNVGSKDRLDFTVIGPAVNMASRLESLTKQLGKPVLLSRAFADLVGGDFDLERVGEHSVRGFSDPIELFAYHG